MKKSDAKIGIKVKINHFLIGHDVGVPIIADEELIKNRKGGRKGHVIEFDDFHVQVKYWDDKIGIYRYGELSRIF